jgi:hypothetical protein
MPGTGISKETILEAILKNVYDRFSNILYEEIETQNLKVTFTKKNGEHIKFDEIDRITVEY